MKCFIKLVKLLFWKNRKTYGLTMDIVYKENACVCVGGVYTKTINATGPISIQPGNLE